MATSKRWSWKIYETLNEGCTLCTHWRETMEKALVPILAELLDNTTCNHWTCSSYSTVRQKCVKQAPSCNSYTRLWQGGARSWPESKRKDGGKCRHEEKSPDIKHSNRTNSSGSTEKGKQVLYTIWHSTFQSCEKIRNNGYRLPKWKVYHKKHLTIQGSWQEKEKREWRERWTWWAKWWWRYTHVPAENETHQLIANADCEPPAMNAPRCSTQWRTATIRYEPFVEH